jgi:hypothetical protein
VNPLLALLVSLGLWMSGQQAPRAELDHIILAINDLDRGIAEFAAQTGVTPDRGGEHPGRNTQNALVSLGEGRYLEILAPSATAPDPDAIVPFRHLAVAGWALHGGPLEPLLDGLRRAGFPTVGPTPGSRRQPGGTLLEWKTGGASGEGLGLAPFLIEWSSATAHPSRTAPGGCRLDTIELRERNPAPLQKFLAALGYSGAVRSGEPGMVVRLVCPKGKVTFATIV